MASVAAAVMRAMPDGVTPRMVSHWMTQGYIDFGDRTRPGTGARRVLSPAERALVAEFAARWLAWVAEGERFRSGAVWADIVGDQS
jgi:hypothetical protein